MKPINQGERINQISELEQRREKLREELHEITKKIAILRRPIYNEKYQERHNKPTAPTFSELNFGKKYKDLTPDELKQYSRLMYHKNEKSRKTAKKSMIENLFGIGKTQKTLTPDELKQYRREMQRRSREKAARIKGGNRLDNRKEQGEQIEKLSQQEPQPSTKIFVNPQLGDKKSAELNAQNFPRLFDGQQQIRNISIIETAQGLDIQTILTPLEIEQEITQFLRNKYQAK